MRLFGHDEMLVFTGRLEIYLRTRTQLLINGPFLQEHACHEIMSTHQVTIVGIGKHPLEASYPDASYIHGWLALLSRGMLQHGDVL